MDAMHAQCPSTRPTPNATLAQSRPVAVPPISPSLHLHLLLLSLGAASMAARPEGRR